jgi:hypothetical protein
MSQSFPEFEAQARAAGFDEVAERRWPPGTVLERHTRYGADGATYWVARRH